MKWIPLPLFNLFINVKAILRRDQRMLKKFHKDTVESHLCRQYNL